jgi:predicted RNA methylase
MSSPKRRRLETASGRNLAPHDLHFLDNNYSAGTLVRSLLYKVRRKLFGSPADILPSYRFGVLVFDRADLDGGGPGFGQDFVRVLREIGLLNSSRVFEFCSGPGYIGYSLLAHGLCRSVALADINPVAIQAARMTAEFNGLSNQVSIYLSDGLDQIPPSEKWDLVVSNPPHFKRWTGTGKLRCEDPDWQIHKKFYAQVKGFLNPGGRVIFQENAAGSTAEDFAPMIRENGGRIIQALPGPDIGAGGSMYYIVSQWD